MPAIPGKRVLLKRHVIGTLDAGVPAEGGPPYPAVSNETRQTFPTKLAVAFTQVSIESESYNILASEKGISKFIEAHGASILKAFNALKLDVFELCASGSEIGSEMCESDSQLRGEGRSRLTRFAATLSLRTTPFKIFAL